MNDHRDLEKGLKKFHHRPDPRVRQSVIARFRDSIAPAQTGKPSTAFWARPIPLYLAAAVLVMAAGLSFFAGRQVPLANPSTGTFQDSVLDTTFTLPQEVLWEPAQNDIL